MEQGGTQEPVREREERKDRGKQNIGGRRGGSKEMERKRISRRGKEEREI